MSTNKSPPRRRRSAKGHPTPGDPAAALPDAMNAPAQPDSARAAVTEAGSEHTLEQTLEALAVDHETAQRIQTLPRDIGWLLVTAGVVGFVMPGVIGVPFLVLGGLMLTPATNRHAERWLSGHSPKIFKGSMRQINRFLDDLERRYPTKGKR